MNIMQLLRGSVPVVVFGCAGIGLFKCIYTVDGGHRAIKFSRLTGLGPKYYREGWHLKLPYFEWPIIYDIRTQYNNTNAITGTKDLQTVNLTVRILYKPMEDKLPELYRFVGHDYDRRVLPSLINEVTRIIVVNIFMNSNRRNTMLPN